MFAYRAKRLDGKLLKKSRKNPFLSSLLSSWSYSKTFSILSRYPKFLHSFPSFLDNFSSNGSQYTLDFFSCSLFPQISVVVFYFSPSLSSDQTIRVCAFRFVLLWKCILFSLLQLLNINLINNNNALNYM